MTTAIAVPPAAIIPPAAAALVGDGDVDELTLEETLAEGEALELELPE